MRRTYQFIDEVNLKFIDIDEVRAVLHANVVDLHIHSIAPYSMVLVANYDDAGCYFYVHLGGLEYLDFAPGLSPGDLQLVDFTEAQRFAPKWQVLTGEYSGPALVIRSTDFESWVNTPSKYLYLIVANQISFSLDLS